MPGARQGDREDTALVGRLSIPDLVATYRAAEIAIRSGYAQVHGAIESLRAAFLFERHGLTLRTKHRDVQADWSDPTDTIVELRRVIWSVLIDRLEVRKMMSVAAWATLENEIRRGEPPEINEENVAGMVAKFKSDVPAMLKAAVDEVFSFLRPPHSRFKTNTEFELGGRVVLSGYITYGYGRTWGVNHYRQQDLIALDNVFAVLDGKLADDSTYGPLGSAINACPHGSPCKGETAMFEFKGFHNGNLHLRFKRMDLVAKLNAIAGGARLKPATDGGE